MSVTATGQGQHNSATHTTLELCTVRMGDNDGSFIMSSLSCFAYNPFPSPGEVLRSDELFLEIEEANSLLENDSIMLELKLLKHIHYFDSSDSNND